MAVLEAILAGTRCHHGAVMPGKSLDESCKGLTTLNYKKRIMESGVFQTKCSFTVFHFLKPLQSLALLFIFKKCLHFSLLYFLHACPMYCLLIGRQGQICKADKDDYMSLQFV